jgi:hypothetical protein
MTYLMKLNALVFMALLLTAVLSSAGAAMESCTATVTATVAPEISIQIVQPEDAVKFASIKYKDLPEEGVTKTTHDEIKVMSNIGYSLYINATDDYLVSKSKKSYSNGHFQGDLPPGQTQVNYLDHHMTAQVIKPESPILATVSTQLEKLYDGSVGTQALKIEFSQLFTRDDEPGSYGTTVYYQGTPAD